MVIFSRKGVLGWSENGVNYMDNIEYPEICIDVGMDIDELNTYLKDYSQALASTCESFRKSNAETFQVLVDTLSNVLATHNDLTTSALQAMLTVALESSDSLNFDFVTSALTSSVIKPSTEQPPSTSVARHKKGIWFKPLTREEAIAIFNAIITLYAASVSSSPPVTININKPNYYIVIDASDNLVSNTDSEKLSKIVEILSEDS